MIGPPLTPLERIIAIPATVVWWTLAPFVYGGLAIRRLARR